MAKVRMALIQVEGTDDEIAALFADAAAQLFGDHSANGHAALEAPEEEEDEETAEDEDDYEVFGATMPPEVLKRATPINKKRCAVCDKPKAPQAYKGGSDTCKKCINAEAAKDMVESAVAKIRAQDKPVAKAATDGKRMCSDCGKVKFQSQFRANGAICSDCEFPADEE